MIIKRIALSSAILLLMTANLIGCADKKNDSGTEGVSFQKIGGYTDPRGQGRVRIFLYSGEPEIEDIKMHTDKLGCGMLFAYYYPESTDSNDIPVVQVETARSLLDAKDALFKGEGVGRWRFGTECLGIIPSITDCMESPISTRCR